MINFGILSYVRRDPPTLPGTLASLLEAFPMSAPQVFTDDGRWGASLNLARALDTLAERSNNLVCVLDDDLLIDKSACARIIEGLQAHGITSCYSLWTIEQNIPHDQREASGWLKVDPHMHLWGGSVVMSPERARLAASHIRTLVAETPQMRTKPDAALFASLEHMAADLYFHIPSLADHAGLAASTIGNTHDHGETRGYKFAK